jgi:L-iditol 2-dehydrogenase
MMLALVYHGPEDLRAETIERPSPRGGEVLVKVAACGVCGTDQRIYSGAHRAYGAGVRRVPGHEIVGEIVDVGPDAPSDLPRGTVVVAPNYGCGHCDQCLSGNNNRCSATRALGMTENGGFAEYVLVPAAAVAQGNLLAFAEAEPSLGVLVEPLATVIRGQDLLDIGPADTVMVVGGGPIGALHVALARLKGAARIILSDHWDNRLAVGRQVGADVAINPRIENIAETVARETNGKGADVIILAAPSHQAQADAMRLAATGGRVSFFAGLPKDRPSTEIETNLIHYKELRVSGTTACSTLDCRRAASLMLAGRMDLSPLLTLDLPLASGVSAFGKSAGRDQLKVTLRT